MPNYFCGTTTIAAMTMMGSEVKVDNDALAVEPPFSLAIDVLVDALVVGADDALVMPPPPPLLLPASMISTLVVPPQH